MKRNTLILFSLILSSLILLTPVELLSQQSWLREVPSATRRGIGPQAGPAQGVAFHLEEANRSFQTNNVVEATIHLIQAREGLNILQRQIQAAQDRVNEAVQYLNQAQPQQASASTTLALDALDLAMQGPEPTLVPAQRGRRENLRLVREDLVRAREQFRAGDVTGAILSIRSAQDTLDVLQQQYPEYQSEIQEAQARLNDAVYFLNQNQPREAAASVRSVVDILESLKEGS